MSTRSVVAYPVGDGWRGRYVHSDGYPAGVGATLVRLVKRDGLETVLRKITQDRYGWATLNDDQPNITGVRVSPSATFGTYAYGTPQRLVYQLRPGGIYGDGRFANEPGYGLAYTTVQGQSDPHDWITRDSHDQGTEWAYVLSPLGIVVLERNYSNDTATWKHRLFVAWGAPDAERHVANVDDS